jgi:outer membrane protein assembly factor BamB
VVRGARRTTGKLHCPRESVIAACIMRFVLPFLLAPLLSSAATDWPQWRGPERTGHVPASEPVITALPAEPKVLWRIPVGDGFASPVVASGKVIFLDNKDAMEIAHAADAATGKILWSTPIFSSHQDGFGIGPRCTPVADGERVFVQSAKGEFQCLNSADGKAIWRTNFVEDFGALYIGETGTAAGASRHGATGSPIIDGAKILAQVGSANGASIVAFDQATGKVVWKSQNDQTAYAAPFLATVAGVRQFISFTADGLIGLDPETGALLWRVPLTTRLARHVTTPVVWNDLVIVASHQLGLVATRLTKTAEGLTASEAWVNKKMTINFTSPVVAGQHLYGLGPAKNFVCIDLATGKLAWEKTGLIQTEGGRAEAGFLVTGSNILTLTDAGELVLFAADPKEYRELGRTQACGKNWCNPAYVGGRLYLRDARELICLDLQK